MGRARERDVIDVNQLWGVYVGNRRHGYLIGFVRHAGYSLARAAARTAFPGMRIGFLERREG